MIKGKTTYIMESWKQINTKMINDETIRWKQIEYVIINLNDSNKSRK